MTTLPVRSRTVVFFDFDQTLVRIDTLPLFLRTLVGESGFKAALKAGVVAALAHPFSWRDSGRAAIFRSVLQNVRLERAQETAQQLSSQLQWKEAVIDTVRRHAESGNTVVIATGSLSLYVPIFLAAGSCPYDYLLATEMEHHDGILTGALASPSCTRQNKANRIKTFLAGHDPFDDSIAYGNLPDDKAMFGLMHTSFVISKHSMDETITPFA